MNRNDEFQNLKEELEQTPFELEYTAAKAIARAKKKKRMTAFWKTPLISFCTTALGFVLLVNLFPAVAFAISKVPGLKDLIQIVSFDASLKTAIENDYYQYIGDSQTKDDVTATIDYMILDAGHISLFFHVDAPVDAGRYDLKLTDTEGKDIPAFICYEGMYEVGKMDELEITLSEENYKLPDKIIANLTINKNYDFINPYTTSQQAITEAPSPTEIATQSPKGVDYTFTFPIYPDKEFSETVDILPIKQWIEYKGQRVFLDRLEVYPTRSRLFLQPDESNTSIINALDICYKDDKGKIYDGADGASGTQDPDTQDVTSIYSESSYFTKTKNLTLYINGFSLIEKDKRYGEIDYSTRSISNLPKDVSVDAMDLKGSDLRITLKVRFTKPNYHSQLISMTYYDNLGNEYNPGHYSSCSSEVDCIYYDEFKIKNYEDNKYKINWIYAPMECSENPISIKIK